MKSKFRNFLVAIAISFSIAAPYSVQAEGSQNLAMPFVVESATPCPDFDKLFNGDANWLGSDGAGSAMLAPGKYLWLFGDTFVKNKSGALKFLHTSSAIFDDVTKTMAFDWDRTAAESSAQKPETHWFWPGLVIPCADAMVLVFKVLEPAENSDPTFRFAWTGDVTYAFRPDKPNLSFDWVKLNQSLESAVSNSKIIEVSKSHLVGTAYFKDGEYTYLYTLSKNDSASKTTGICRLTNKDLLGADYSKLQYWSGSDWSADATKSAILFNDGAAEMTVAKITGEPYLVATYMAPLSNEISLRFAEKPEGPWTRAIKAYVCPEGKMKVLNKSVSVYSAKDHPELAREDGELIVTYCSNPGELKHFEKRPDLYRPHFISIKLRATR